MEAKILELMKKNSQQRGIVPPKAVTVIPPPRASPTYFQPKEGASRQTSEDSRLAGYLNLPIKYEIEASFGVFFQNEFVPGVTIFQFNNLLAKLTSFANENKWDLSKKHTIEEIGKPMKKITIIGNGENAVIWQEKIRNRDDKIDNYLWGYRINKSEERTTDTGPQDFKFTITREKYRTTVVANEDSQNFKNVRFDLTKVVETKVGGVSDIKYEVEIERIEKGSLQNFKKALDFVIKTMQRNLFNPENVINTGERSKAMFLHNSLFGKRGDKDLFSKYWNKPENLKIRDLIDPKNKYYLTLKLDGIRVLVLITKNGIYACIPPFDIWKIGSGVAALDGTLLDTEMYTTQDTSVYYIFDCLFSKKRDIRNNNLDYRLKEVENTTKSLDSNVFKMKPFYHGGSFYENYENLRESLKDIDLAYDGIILQSTDVYRNKNTRKYKPPVALTIDFKLERDVGENTNEFFLLVKTQEGYQKFSPDGEAPFKITIPDGKLDLNNSNNTVVSVDADGIIVECAWENDKFVPVKYRDDKEEANFITTVNSIWQDIKDPITVATIRGRTLITMRKYHNMAKERLLETFKRNDVILDWGSGRGGDILKWKKIGFSKVYAVEPNEEFLEILKKRAKELDFDKKITVLSKYESPIGRVYIGAEEYSHVESALESPIDGIVSFFSLTFFGKDMYTFDNMIETVNRVLPKSKKFVGIVMDGQKVVELLDGKSKYDDPAFSIEKITEFVPGKIAEGTNEIKIEIKEASSMVKYNEWLFYFDVFVEKLKKIGVNLVSTGFLDEKGIKGFNDSAEIFKNLPISGQTFSRLNRYFIFERGSVKKTTTIDNLNFGDLIGTQNKFVEVVSTNKNTSFLEAVMGSVDKSYVFLSDGEKEKRAKRLRKAMSNHLTPEFYDKLGDRVQESTFEEFKISLANEKVEIPVTIYADILSNLLRVNILIVTDKGKYVKFDSETKLFGCYEETSVIYGRKGIYGMVTDTSDPNEIIRIYKTKSDFIKKILKDVVEHKKYNKVN